MASSSKGVRVSAPARANLIGNPSDLYGGAVLSCSVPLRARALLQDAQELELQAGDDVLRVRDPADLDPRGDVFDIARSVLRHLGELPRCSIRLETDIPRQSGLGGSTALQVALLRGLWTWLDRDGSRYELAEAARDVERKGLGIRCGYVDQYMSAFGGLRYVDLRGKQTEPAERLYATVEDLVPETTALPALPFVLAFTGVRHHSGRVHAPIRERWERGETAVVQAYERMVSIALEGKAAFLRADWVRFGRLMDENHGIQQRLGGTGEADDRLVEAARSAGALGAKLAGAGHGGTIVALCPDSGREGLERRLRDAGAVALYRLSHEPGASVEVSTAG